MELLFIIILILLGIIIPIKIFKPTFVLLAGAITLLETITLPTITAIGETITYATVPPLYQWALGLILIVTAVILYLDQIDLKGENNGFD